MADLQSIFYSYSGLFVQNIPTYIPLSNNLFGYILTKTGKHFSH